MSSGDKLLKLLSELPSGYHVQIGPEVDPDDLHRFLAATAWSGCEDDPYEGLLFGVSAQDGDWETLARLLTEALETRLAHDERAAQRARRHEASCGHGDCWCKPGSDGT